MCGILFIYGPKSLERVQYSLPKLIHRGPDDQQIIIGENMALGFTRLAINGVGKVGSQPMKFQEMLGAFNGEIYNHQSLSEKYNLPLSSSDTEVILPLFKKIKIYIITQCKISCIRPIFSHYCCNNRTIKTPTKKNSYWLINWR